MKKHRFLTCLLMCCSFHLVNGCNDSSSTAPVAPPGSGDTIPPFLDPLGVTTSAGIESVTVSWTAATDNIAIDGYKITIVSPVLAARTSALSRIVGPTARAITWIGLSGGVLHTFDVLAFDSSNNPSNVVEVSETPLILDTTPPVDVTDLSGAGGWNDPVAQNFVQMTLTWTASTSTDVSHYLVCVGTSAGSCDVVNNVSVGNATTVTIPDVLGPITSADLPPGGLVIDTPYSVRVITVDTSSNQSSPGATATVVPTQSTDVTPPAPVRNLTSTPGNGQVQLNWLEPLPLGDANRFAVYVRPITVPGDFEIIPWGNAVDLTSTSSSTVTALPDGTLLVNGNDYEFMVAGIDDTGNETVGALTPATSDDAAAKVLDTPTSNQIFAVPSIRGGVFRQAFFTSGRNVVIMVSTSVPNLLSSTSQFFYTLDGGNIDTQTCTNDQTHGCYDFSNANVSQQDPLLQGRLWAITIDFNPFTFGGVPDRVDQNNLRPAGGADHIILKYKIKTTGDASRRFTETYLIYPDLVAPANSFYKFSGMRAVRFHPTATLIESGLTAGDVIVIGGKASDALLPPALDGASRYRSQFEHFEEIQPAPLSLRTATMNERRFIHHATLLQDGATILLTGGFNFGSSSGFFPFPVSDVANRSLGRITSDIFDANPADEGFAATANMNQVRSLHTATRLFDGRVLLMGGLNGENILVGAELTDPQTTVPEPLGASESPAEMFFVPLVPPPPASQIVPGLIGQTVELLSSVVSPRFLVRRGVITNSVQGLANTQKLELKGFLGDVTVGTAFRIINTETSSTELYDATGGLSAPGPSMTLGRYGHTATLLHDGTVFVAGGSFNYRFDAADSPTRFQLSTEIYDPDTNVITRLGTLADMTVTRYFHSATLLRDGKVLITGGVDRGDYIWSASEFRDANIRNSAEIFDPFTRETRAVGAMNETRMFHQSVLLPSGKVLIIGGYTGTVANSGIPLRDKSAEIFDPDTGLFTPTPDMLTFRGPVGAALIQGTNTAIEGHVLVVGGSSNTLAELYNESSAEFEATAHGMSYDHFVGSVSTPLRDGTVLVTGGQTADPLLVDPRAPLRAGEFLDKAEIYDTSTVSFTKTSGDMANPRRHHTATVLQDDTVLIAGGENDLGGLAETAIFDPSTGIFSTGARMLQKRYKHTATLLPDGRVFVCGGASLIGPLQSCEVYDPTTRSFRSVPPLSLGRFDHTATLLSGGRVLITGGESIDDTSIEIFDSTIDDFVVPVVGNMIVGRNGHTALQPAYSIGRARFTNLSTTVTGSTAVNPFAFDDTAWSLNPVRVGDIIISENDNAIYEIASVLAGVITLTTPYQGTSTGEVLTGDPTFTGGFEYYTIISQDVYIAGGVVSDTRTEVFQSSTGTFAAALPLNQGRFGHALASQGDMGLVIVGGRNPTSGEFTNAVDTNFANDAWVPSPLDFSPLNFPNAFRARNNMVIVTNQHSAQAFFDDL